MVLKELSRQKARDAIIKREENRISLKGQNELTQTEINALNICKVFQKATKEKLGVNLSDDIHENCKDLVILYKMKRVMEDLRTELPKHEVKDERTGKVFGELYDNEYVGNVMLSTNISINAQIQHTEWHIRKISCSKHILKK